MGIQYYNRDGYRQPKKNDGQDKNLIFYSLTIEQRLSYSKNVIMLYKPIANYF